MSEVRPRDVSGRFVPTLCPDQNRGGRLFLESEGWWRCNGLTYRQEEALEACGHVFHPIYAPAKDTTHDH